MLKPYRRLVVALSLFLAVPPAHAADVAVPDMMPLAHKGPVLSCAFSPDGKLVATAGADKVVRLFDLATGRETARLEPGVKVGGIAFSPDGRRLAAVVEGDAVQVWDVSTAKGVNTIHSGYHGDPGEVVFFSDGRRISSSRGLNVSRCDAVTAGPLGTTSFGDGVSLALAPDGKTLARGVDGKLVLLWDIENYRELGRIDADPKAVIAAAFASDGKTLATAGSEKTIRLWDVATRKESRKIESATEVRRLAFQPDGKALAAAGADKLVRLYDVAGGKESRVFGDVVGKINALAFSADGSRVVTAGDDGVAVWDLKRDEKPLPKDLKVTAKELDALWADLGADDGRKAYAAARTLRALPAQSVPFLEDRLKPRDTAADEKRIKQLIADLDSDDFSVREKAMEELARFGKGAEPALRAAKAAGPSAEVSTRLDVLLERLGRTELTPEQTRDVRAVRVLGQAGTPEAKKLLEALVKDSPGWWVTEEAKAALARTAKEK